MATKVKFTKVAKESSLPATSDSEDQAGSLYFVTETGNIYLDGYNVRHKMTPEYKLTTEDNGLRFTAIKGEQTKSSYIDLGGIGGTDYAIGGNLGVTENSTVYIEKNIDAGLTDLNENDHTVMVNSEYLPLTSSNSTTGTVIVGGNGAQPILSEGTNATIVGANTSFSATNNTVVGTQASATGDNASAIGAQSEATGVNSVALGYNSKATGDDVISVGNNEESLLRRITGVFPATLDKDGLKPADADSNDSQNGTSLFDAVTRYDLEESRIHPGDGLAIEYDSTDYLAGEALNPTGTNVTVTHPELSVKYDNSTIGINSNNQLTVVKDYADKSHTHTKDEITDLPTVKDGVSVTASDTFYILATTQPKTPTGAADPSGWSKTEPTPADTYTGNEYRCIRTTLSDGTALWTTPTVVASFSFAQKAYQTASGAVSDYSTLKQTVDNYNQTYGQRFTDLEGSVSDCKTSIQQNAKSITLKADSDTVVVPNLLYGTETFPTSGSGTDNKRRYYTDWQERGVTSKTDDGIKLTLTGDNTDCIFVPMADTSGELLEASTEYTLSFTYRGTLTEPGLFYFLPTSGSNYAFYPDALFTGDEQWHDAAITITTPASGSDGLKGCAMLLFYALNYYEGKYIEVKAKSLKLEKGSKVTEWSAARSELTTSAQLSVKQGEILSTVSDKYATKDGSGTKESDVRQLSDSVTTQFTEVYNLQSRNLVGGTATPYEYTRTSYANNWLDKFPVYTNTDYGFTVIQKSEGKPLTLSCDYRIENITTECDMDFCPQYSEMSYDCLHDKDGNEVGLLHLNVGSNSGHYEQTFYTTAAQRQYFKKWLISGFGAGKNPNAKIRIWNFRLNYGEKAAAWAQAPEDTNDMSSLPTIIHQTSDGVAVGKGTQAADGKVTWTDGQFHTLQGNGTFQVQDASGNEKLRVDNNRYLYTNYINSDTGNNENTVVSQIIVTNGEDNYYRKASASHVISSSLTKSHVTTALGYTPATAHTIPVVAQSSTPSDSAVKIWIKV